MQTFLAADTVAASTMVLDRARLGKQRSEAAALITSLENGGGWSHHPAAKMWRNNIPTLKLYYNWILAEWERRGYRNNMPRYPLFDTLGSSNLIDYPSWWEGAIHSNHRQALLYKAHLRAWHTGNNDLVDWYEQWGWTETVDFEEIAAGYKFRHYFWPVR